ncbi:16S rRNA (cytosine967-C5)-methyltransferase [Agromyces flavus]|uniref:16S rRNA (Cytosine967-C5)-methyltransferase n=1 Tax=Agromyces flavus TaxID=589382 RepID=A0A1H1QXP4_9MICO|nr:16S rRNA (cytosine967-C5)-methyltransferase [Agromyces flavus]GGI47125.1 methyltransferase [Agromyces flavus]SDS27649.1 16S rRNA (cytosine967-C5)-methyltransferase [Agromyces flavus]
MTDGGGRDEAKRSGARGKRPQGRGGRPDTISRARQVAYDVIEAVRDSDAYANLLLPARIRRAGLSEADAAFATELTYGTLRRQGYYDAVIALAAGRPIDAIDPGVLDVLRLGAHQLLATRVATHAAVNESVALARRVQPKAAGFVNAVLRTVSRREADRWRELVAAEAGSPDQALAAVHSHPLWVVRALRTALDREGRADELVELLEADNASPRVNLVALPGLVDDPAALGDPDRYSPVGSTADQPLRVVEQHAGRVRVQDEGSQLAALALSRSMPVRTGERWLDLCAGPGGKTALLAAEALAGGATLVANEVVPSRAELVRRAVAPVPLDVPVREGDGRELDPGELGAPGGFDRILLDAPCTGLGALRRRPEARWRKSPADVPELTALQGELADAAFRALAPGGVLAYVTCSPHAAETHGTLGRALERWGADAEQLDTASVVQGLSRHPLDLAGDGRTVQLWPHRHGTDAMFIALLRRR